MMEGAKKRRRVASPSPGTWPLERVVFPHPYIWPDEKPAKQIREEREQEEERKEREEEEREASAAVAMERMAQSDFPKELLWKIIGTSLRSGMGRWDITAKDRPAALERGGLTWPEDLNSSTRRTIRQAVVEILPESVVLGIPATFEQALQGDKRPRLVVPRALRASKRDVRNLVLNLDLGMVLSLDHGRLGLTNSLSTEWPSVKLGTATAGTETVAEDFPLLDTCVLLIDIGHIDKLEHVSYAESHSFPLSFPELSHIEGGEFLAALIKLVDTFAKRGPGKRRLLRFSCQEQTVRWYVGMGSDFEEAPTVCKAGVGPLVRVDVLGKRVVNDNAGNSDAMDATHMQEPVFANRDSSRSKAERLFHQAFQLKRQIRCREDQCLPRHRSLSRIGKVPYGMMAV
jgi:hypothetical protein